FCNAANENFSMYGSGVCWIDNSRSRFKPRNANGRMEEMLLPSRVSLRSTRRPANASPFITGKLFFVSDNSSTLSGNCCAGMSSRPPVLQSTCNEINYRVLFHRSSHERHALIVTFITKAD
ncbi:hypothetical protein ALC57_08706, partial [Trachymyrmex cornetzi]